MTSRPEVHGIRPRSLAVTAIAALMTEVAGRNANCPQISTHGEFPRGHGPRYGGNLFAQRRAATVLLVEIRTVGFFEDKCPNGAENNPPIFSGTGDGPEDEISASRGKGEIASDSAIAHLDFRGPNDLRRMGKDSIRGPFIDKIVISGPPDPNVPERRENNMNYG